MRPDTMRVEPRMATILFLVMCFNYGYACDVDMAVYKVTLQFLWSEEVFPKDYPLHRPKAQWSPCLGISHNSSYKLYEIGEIAKPEVRNFAQFGRLDDIVETGNDDSRLYDQFSTTPVGNGTGKAENMLFLGEQHSFISVICRIIPSPDWFIGVNSLDLCVNSKWVEQISLDLYPLDAGAASGLTFTAPRWATSPPDPVTRHGPRTPNHPAAGFYYPEMRELPAIAKIEFSKMKEYSTKEINDLARKELLKEIKGKGNKKYILTRKVNAVEIKKEEKETTTKDYLNRLIDLEEDPIGTPRPNVPENNVIVVTRRPSVSTEKQFIGELKNMDDVVLAVANGRKLGRGKHLPRHFRSRLHHAVNKIQPEDCLVSEWNEWTPCSVSCGFGDKFRTRKVIRQKLEKGRDCPPLKERQHCGNVNSCAQVDYFEW